MLGLFDIVSYSILFYTFLIRQILTLISFLKVVRLFFFYDYLAIRLDELFYDSIAMEAKTDQRRKTKEKTTRMIHIFQLRPNWEVMNQNI